VLRGGGGRRTGGKNTDKHLEIGEKKTVRIKNGAKMPERNSPCRGDRKTLRGGCLK